MLVCNKSLSTWKTGRNHTLKWYSSLVLLLFYSRLQCYVLDPHAKVDQFLPLKRNFPCSMDYNKSSVHVCHQFSSVMSCMWWLNLTQSSQWQKAKELMYFMHHMVQHLGRIREYTYVLLSVLQDHSTPTYDSQQPAGSHVSTDWQACPGTGVMMELLYLSTAKNHFIFHLDSYKESLHCN